MEVNVNDIVYHRVTHEYAIVLSKDIAEIKLFIIDRMPIAKSAAHGSEYWTRDINEWKKHYEVMWTKVTP